MTRPTEFVVTPTSGEPYRVTLAARAEGWVAEVDRGGERWSFDLAAGPRPGLARVGFRPLRWRWDREAGRLSLGGDLHRLTVETEAAHRLAAVSGRSAGGGSRDARAPMPGLVVAILVEEGGEVAAGQGVVVIEAMKMENEIAAPAAGVVREIAVRTGQPVEKGAPLFRIEASP